MEKINWVTQKDNALVFIRNLIRKNESFSEDHLKALLFSQFSFSSAMASRLITASIELGECKRVSMGGVVMLYRVDKEDGGVINGPNNNGS